MEIALDPGECLLPYRHQSFLAAFADDAYHTRVPAELTQTQANKLGYTQPASVQRLQHGSVAQTECHVDIWCSQKRIDIFLCQHFRQTARELGGVYLQGRIRVDPLLSLLIAVETFQTG